VTVLESTGHAVEVQLAEQLGVQDASQQVRLALAFADRLELPAAFKASRELMDRGEKDLPRVVQEGQAEARRVEAKGLQRLVRGPLPIAFSDVTDIGDAVDPWLDADISQGRVARAVDRAMRASRMAREQAYQAAVAESSGFYSKLQKLAADVVFEVGKLKPLPRQVWGTPDPPGLMIREGRGPDWSAMVLAQERFVLIHEAGRLKRGMGGLGAQGQLNGPPNLAFA
jgi:hypothetical protein